MSGEATAEAAAPASVERQTARFDIHITLRVRRAPRGAAVPDEETVMAESLGLRGARILTTLDLIPGEIVRIEEVAGPFRVAARVLSLVPAAAGQRAHLVFLGAGSTLRDWLVRARVLPPPGGVSVETPFTGENERLAICEAVEEAFSGVPGDWRVVIALVKGFTPPWWLVTVDGKYDLFVLSLSSAEQTPEQVRERLRERLRRRRLVD